MNLNYLKDKHKKFFVTITSEIQKMFDGTLAKYTIYNYTIELKEDAKPYHTKTFPIPTIYEPTLKKEVNKLIKIRVLKIINSFQWTAPTFIIPMINGKVKFLSHLRELN